MAASPKTAREKARKARADARRADADYQAAKAKARRERKTETRKAERTKQKVSRRQPRLGLRRWIGVSGYVLVGAFPYAASGLLLPAGAVLVLLGIWTFGLMWTIRLARTSPAWTPLAPVIAVVLWIVLVQVGDQTFGWLD